jgi:UDP-N-acetylglucosamine--N-acetylmuramyl-(pentapeptide) pyrophosphoryl-undecaprenol N-acetylglucosamine transferase
MNERFKMDRMIIAGGGTGGHLFPGLAVAETWAGKRGRESVLFVTGRRKMESALLSSAGWQQTSIAIEGIKGRGWRVMGHVLFMLPMSCFQSLSALRRFKPSLVLGVGGYSAGPVCLVAKILRIPTAIHEQNSIPGLTNRLLCRLADRVFISFAESGDHFPGGQLILTGNPIREDLFRERRTSLRKDAKFTLLVMGGSQGAKSINRAFVAAWKILKEKGLDIQVVHQTGEKDYPFVAEEYSGKDVSVALSPFIQDMGEAYNRADLAICRAGATTVAELAALGKPSILVPYPYAANNHQEKNADVLVKVGGAVKILEKDLQGEDLATRIMGYLEDQSLLAEMSRKAATVGRRDAVHRIVDQLEDMIRKRRGERYLNHQVHKDRVAPRGQRN